MVFFIAVITFFLEGKIIGMKPIKQPFFLCQAFSVFLNEDSLCPCRSILQTDFFFVSQVLLRLGVNTGAVQGFFFFFLCKSKMTLLIHYATGGDRK